MPPSPIRRVPARHGEAFRLNVPASPRVAQIVPAEILDPGALEHLLPCLGRDLPHRLALVAEHTHKSDCRSAAAALPSLPRAAPGSLSAPSPDPSGPRQSCAPDRPDSRSAQSRSPIRYENQGVRTWVALGGSSDPPVYVDLSEMGLTWTPHAPTFSRLVYANDRGPHRSPPTPRSGASSKPAPRPMLRPTGSYALTTDSHFAARSSVWDLDSVGAYLWVVT
jgi:hypothetical protein